MGEAKIRRALRLVAAATDEDANEPPVPTIKPTVQITLGEAEVDIVRSIMEFGGVCWNAWAPSNGCSCPVVERSPADGPRYIQEHVAECSEEQRNAQQPMPENEIKLRACLFFLEHLRGLKLDVTIDQLMHEHVAIVVIDERHLRLLKPARVKRLDANVVPVVSSILGPDGEPITH